MARRSPHQRSFVRRYIPYAIILILMIGIGYIWHERIYILFKQYTRPPIPIGILHSRSGTMGMQEFELTIMAHMAIKEINEAGGVLGRRLVAVDADGKSDEQEFAQQAKRLIVDHHVPVIFGCWTSASRKAVKPIVEHHNNLLMYSVQYEGIEESPNIFYLGATPNQQIIPTISWAMKWFGSKFFLIGSDYIYPHIAHAIMKDAIAAQGGTVVGEQFISFLDEHQAKEQIQKTVARIHQTQPNIILNTINGSLNFQFFASLRKAGISASDIPVISYSINAEDDGSDTGHYVAWSYFNNINSSDNIRFHQRLNQVSSLSKSYISAVSDPEETTYIAFHLWARAAEAAGTTNPQKVKKQLVNTSFPAPEGTVYLSSYHHLWRPMRIGKVTYRTIAQQFTGNSRGSIVWSSDRSIEPQIYPLSRSPKEWQALVDKLYIQWGNKWTRS